ncbi:MAG TPA: shikimate kinase [Phycisphaerales bacterium]|nr:shikimate kinase [Phycisphaerales bacterium]
MGAHTRSILLLALRAGGKTTLGARLAAKLALPFIDLDDRTAAILGAATAGDALRTRGEPAFRAAESQALELVLAGPTAVVAFGGGTPTAPGAAELIDAAREHGLARTIYLRATPATLQARLRTSNAAAGRPALLGTDPVAEVPSIFAARDPLYRGLADVVIDTDGLDAHTVLARLMDAARER